MKKATSRRRKLGLLAGKLAVPSDFDDPLPEEVTAMFEGDRAELGKVEG
jgi:hypothetical protein